MATPVFLPGKFYGQSGAWQESPSPWDRRVRHNLVIKTKHFYFLATLHCMWDLASVETRVLVAGPLWKSL